MAEKKKTIRIGEKDVELTKKGLPNLRQLSGVARQVVKEYAEKQKKEKKEILVREITEILSKLD
jgi:hypothetical protein